MNLSFPVLFYAVDLSSPTGVRGKHKKRILMKIKIMRQSPTRQSTFLPHYTFVFAAFLIHFLIIFKDCWSWVEAWGFHCKETEIFCILGWNTPFSSCKKAEIVKDPLLVQYIPTTMNVKRSIMQKRVGSVYVWCLLRVAAKKYFSLMFQPPLDNAFDSVSILGDLL